MAVDYGGPFHPIGRQDSWHPVQGASLLDDFARTAMGPLLEHAIRSNLSDKDVASDAYGVARAMIAEKRRLESLEEPQS